MLYGSTDCRNGQPVLDRRDASSEIRVYSKRLARTPLWVRYLDYLNKVAPENPSLKTEDFPDQKRAP